MPFEFKYQKCIYDPPMIGIQGPPATGKTTAALTFPNPIVANFDRGLSNPQSSVRVQQLPFYDDEFCLKDLRWPSNNTGAPNKRDGFKTWLVKEAIPNLQADQTFIIDSWSALQASEEAQTGTETFLTKENKVDDRRPWNIKFEYSNDVMHLLTRLRCTVVVIFHEAPVRNDKGQILEAIAPLQAGKFVCAMARYFSDFMRQHAFNKLKPDNTELELPGYGKLKEETEYFWQVKSNPLFRAKTRHTYPHMYIPAKYSSLIYAKQSTPISTSGTKPASEKSTKIS